MPKEQIGREAQPELKRTQIDPYYFRIGTFLRICLSRKRKPVDVAAAAGIPKKTYNNMKNGHAVDIENYCKLADELDCEPTSLFSFPESPIPLDSPVRAFARRVEELIEDGAIPAVDPDTGEQVDVVHYVWQLGDPELSSIRLTHDEERQGFLLLRDSLLQLIERPSYFGTRRNVIGKMELGVVPREDILADIDARRLQSEATFKLLEKQFRQGYIRHTLRIRRQLPNRFRQYLRAVEADKANLAARRNDPISVKAENDVEFAVKSANIESREYYLPNPALVRHVVESDFFVRMIVFPTHQQDETFRQFYSRSRRMIEHMIEKRPLEFIAWWPGYRDDNTDNLQVFVDAWDEKKGEVPVWKAMRDALSKTLESTIEQIEDLYPTLPEAS
ncbi:MAG: hypothetical protein Aurels2KO_54000 [Aureliella sp.]